MVGDPCESTSGDRTGRPWPASSGGHVDESFNFDEVFDEDYLYFYADRLDDERSQQDAAFVAGLLGLEPGMRVLDVPCGHGRIARRLPAWGAEVVGVDSNPLFLERARQDAAARGVDVDYVHGDIDRKSVV